MSWCNSLLRPTVTIASWPCLASTSCCGLQLAPPCLDEASSHDRQWNSTSPLVKKKFEIDSGALSAEAAELCGRSPSHGLDKSR